MISPGLYVGKTIIELCNYRACNILRYRFYRYTIRAIHSHVFDIAQYTITPFEQSIHTRLILLHIQLHHTSNPFTRVWYCSIYHYTIRAIHSHAFNIAPYTITPFEQSIHTRLILLHILHNQVTLLPVNISNYTQII